MKSTITRDLVKVNGVITIGYKEYPDWYGIEGIGFIWHNSWADPELEYKGKIVNSYIVEDTMWERWIYDDDDNLIPERENDEDGFGNFMRENAEGVYELLENIIENMEVEEWNY